MRKTIILLPLLLCLIYCQREWIGAEFTRTDTGSTMPDYTNISEEPAKEEPSIIKKTDLGNSKVYIASDKLILPRGTGENEIGIDDGGEDELPSGPMSFAVDKNGDIHILDNQNSVIKIFNQNKVLQNIISIGSDAKSLIDITISRDDHIALADISSNIIYIVKKTSKSVSEYTRLLKIPDTITDFGGLFSSVNGNIFLRYQDQRSLRINETGIHIPIMSLISRGEDFFLRTKRVSEKLSMLFLSRREQSTDYRGNTEKQIEIAIGMPILSVSLIDTDTQGRSYLLIEADGGGSETVNVRRFVLRAGTRDEDWSKPLEIPLDTYTLPFKDIVIGEDGTVYAMLVYKDRVEVAKWKAE
ncbi:MAG: hypothetical protein N3B13_05005 [Deltaproteobacteria bacterium]|nr:hypothetical protein [Deltaproteobacteria bacterium]